MKRIWAAVASVLLVCGGCRRAEEPAGTPSGPAAVKPAAEKPAAAAVPAAPRAEEPAKPPSGPAAAKPEAVQPPAVAVPAAPPSENQRQALAAQLTTVNLEIAAARKKALEEDPGIKALEAEVAALQKEFEDTFYGDPDTNALRAERSATEAKLAALERQQSEIGGDEAQALQPQVLELRAYHKTIIEGLNEAAAANPDVGRLKREVLDKSTQLAAQVDKTPTVAPLLARKAGLVREMQGR